MSTGPTNSGGQGAADARSDWLTLARSAAARGGERDEGELLRELLAFRLGGIPYAIPVERVREIVRLREITPMPRVPDFVKGVVALRGEIVQVVDLRMRLGMEPQEPTRASRIIVLHGDDQKVTGVLVDAVQEVMRVSESEVSPAVAPREAPRPAPEVRERIEGLPTFGALAANHPDMDRVLDIGADD